MSFVYPAFLFASALIAIPIIIHLFNFRRYKTVYFTNVRFLREVKEETTSRSKLKHLLVLASRILMLLFLVLAFAQPYIPVSTSGIKKEGTRAISIYIDNSFSMNAENEGESLLNKAKQKARDIVKAYSAAERFQLLTNDFEGRQQRFLTRDEFLAMVDEVKASPQVRPMKDVLALQKKVFTDAHAETKVAYLLSDFQKNAGDFVADSSVHFTMVPLVPSALSNVYIDTAWFEKPLIYANQTGNIIVRLKNKGDQPIEKGRLTLAINGQQKGLSDFNIVPNGSITDTVNFTVQDTGWNQADLSIIDYPVTFDDHFYMAFKAVGQVNVLAINEDKPSPYLTALYSVAAEKFTLTNQGARQLDYSKLNTYSLIVLNNLTDIPSGLASELDNYVQGGGALMIYPSAKANIDSYNKLLSALGMNTINGTRTETQPVGNLNKDHEIFKDVFETIPENLALPNTKMHYTFTAGTRSTEQKIMGFRDGGSFLSQYAYKGGKVFICATPLDKDQTDFPVQGIFGPIMYKMALMGGHVLPASYTLGEDKQVEINNTDASSEVAYKMKNAKNEFIPQQRRIGNKVLISLNERVVDAGVYQVNGDKEKTEALVALNFNRTESDLEYYTMADLKKLYPGKNMEILDGTKPNITEMVRELDRGVVLWKLCVIFALIFIGAEVLLLRFLR